MLVAERDPTRAEVKLMQALTRQFHDDQEPHARSRVAGKMYSFGLAEAILNAAEMHQEIALHPDITTSDREGHIDRSEDMLRQVKRMGTRGNVVSDMACSADLRLARLPSFTTLALGKALPDGAATLDEYMQYVEAADKTLAQARDGYHSVDAKHVGEASEASVQLLLMRFGINEVPGEYLPFYSQYSQDKGNAKRTAINNRWDVTLFTQLHTYETPDPTYALQVKTTNSAYSRSKGRYAPGITVVHVIPDLVFPSGDIRPGVIIEECVAELEGNTEAGRLLDERTVCLHAHMG